MPPQRRYGGPPATPANRGAGDRRKVPPDTDTGAGAGAPVNGHPGDDQSAPPEGPAGEQPAGPPDRPAGEETGRRLAGSAGEVLARGWWHRPVMLIAAVLIAANALAGITTFAFLQFMLPVNPGLHAARNANQVIVIAFVVYLAVAIPGGALTNARIFRPVARWTAAGRRPDPVEQWATLVQPIRQAAGAFAFWLVAAVVFAVLLAVEGYPGHRIIAAVVAIILGGLASCTLSALLIERGLRPIVAVALGGDLPIRPSGVGIRPRLLLAWAFGSGVPFVGLMLTVTDPDITTARAFLVPSVFIGAVGLAAGFTLIGAAAQSVAEPLERVRAALERIEAGDLTVELQVDDGGEVGRLEAGVNHMVAGLRQRQRLEDLFGRYVGAAVARRALEQGELLGGERRQASMLFVDIIGSTRMAARLPPELVVATLNRFFRSVVEVVSAEGGWVNKFAGDGALCVFGAPGDDRDHATRALRTARRLHQAFTASDGEAPIDAAIGVSCGEVVAGNVGSPERFEYTIIGDAVNVAARLTELAKDRPGRVLASDSALGSAAPGEQRRWEPAGSTILRGRSYATPLFAPGER
jgi:adenylate cyclase